MIKALFLDRDGTINVDYGYVHERARFSFIDGIFDFCRYAQSTGFQLIVITNQSGIARGYFSEEEYQDVTSYMVGCFANEGIRILDILHCPFLDGPDRKPNPGLFITARDKYDIDMAASVSVGDNERDVIAGQRAGVGMNLLFSGDFNPLILKLSDWLQSGHTDIARSLDCQA